MIVTGHQNQTAKLWQTTTVRRSIISEGQTSSRSSFFQRIQRKPQERSVSASKRSRKSSGEKEEVQLNGFYTKMKVIKGEERQRDVEGIMSGVNLVHGARGVLNGGNYQQKQRRRTPTPAHGRLSKQSQKNTSPPAKNSSIQNIELQLKIDQLQRSLQGQKVQREAAQKRALVFQNKFKQKIRAVKQLQDQIQTWRREVDDGKNSVVSRSNMSHGIYESREAEAKGTLQMIKKSYRQFRIDELERKNQLLSCENDGLREQLTKIKEENQLLRLECDTLREEIYGLTQQSESTLLTSKQNQLDSLKYTLSLSQSQRQCSLMAHLHQLQHLLSIQKSKTTKLQLKLDYINRKKNQQIQMVIARKEKDISSIRNKLSLLARQTMQLRRGNSSRKAREWSGGHQEEIDFVLSPEK